MCLTILVTLLIIYLLFLFSVCYFHILSGFAGKVKTRLTTALNPVRPRLAEELFYPVL